MNVDVGHLSGNQVESSTAVNPTNPLNIVSVSSTDSNGGSDIIVSRSTDGGATWSITTVGAAQDHASSANPRNDPHAAFDAYGNLYVVYMVGLSRRATELPVARSVDGGASFHDATIAVISPAPDFPVIATGPDSMNSRRQAVYVAYTDYAGRRVDLVSAFATGRGRWTNFTRPITVSHRFGATPSVAVGSQGQVAVAWQDTDSGSVSSNLYVDVSAARLSGFGRRDILVAPVRVGGAEPIPAQPTRTIFASPSVTFDTSTSSARGRLFLSYVDANVAGSADTDIELRYSDTLGASWSAPIKVNDDATRNSQFLPALAVDPQSGNVGLDWYDARESAGNNEVRLYAAVSVDHGVSFGANAAVSWGTSAVSSARYGTRAVGSLDLGDYVGAAFTGGRFIATWADNSNAAGGNPDGASDFDIYASVLAAPAIPTSRSSHRRHG